MQTFIENYIQDSINIKEKLLKDKTILVKIEKAAETIINAYKNSNKVLIAGNGGSAADSQHIAAELVAKFCSDRAALNAIALTTNTSILTSIENDWGHEFVFARQIQAYGQKGDVFIAISTSGESINIIKAVEEAKTKGLTIIGLTGMKNCTLDSLCDLVIKVPSETTPIIQESHIMIGHIICAIIEKSLF